MKSNNLIKYSLVFGLSLIALPSYSQAINAWGSGSGTPARSTNHSKPEARGFLIPTAEEIPNGAKLDVEIFHSQKDDAVSLWLQVAINDGKGDTRIYPLKLLSDKEKTNPKDYYSKRSFTVTYDELNKELKKIAPNSKMKIVPGTPLFVYGLYHDLRGNGWGDHQWGGVARGGVVAMPGHVTAQVNTAGAKSARPQELDIAFQVEQTLANNFNDSKNHGLKVGGQIRSRVEAEGKYQIPLSEFDNTRKRLLELANDPVEAEKLLGKDWTLKLEDRYLQKTAGGKLKMKDGFPVPDPMVDTYYDNAAYQAAENDMAIRYRWTEGNRTGAWNFKPGLDQGTPDGVVYRVEYGVDTTDNKPKTISKFVDSTHPLNPFQTIRDLVPNSTPSDFLLPSVLLTDYRYKFKLQHKNGLIVEVSLDDVEAKSLRDSKIKPIRYVQMEMDIDHLSTTSNNTSSVSGQLKHVDPKASGEAKWLGNLKTSAFIDGRPVIHNIEDLDVDSPIRKARKGEFELAAKAIRKIRDDVTGGKWLPGPQKYAIAAHALGLTKKKGQSQSVTKLLRKAGIKAGAPSSSCSELFVTLLKAH